MASPAIGTIHGIEEIPPGRAPSARHRGTENMMDTGRGRPKPGPVADPQEPVVPAPSSTCADITNDHACMRLQTARAHPSS
jgi:hypothetical protein